MIDDKNDKQPMGRHQLIADDDSQDADSEVREYTLKEWLNKLQYYLDQLEQDHDYHSLTIVMNCLDAIYTIMDEGDIDLYEYDDADTELDNMLPFWLPFLVSAWQRYNGQEDTMITKGAFVHYDQQCH